MTAPVVADALDLETAFQLASPRKVVRAIREDRHTAYAARDSIRRAAREQPPAWQTEFWQEIRRHRIDL